MNEQNDMDMTIDWRYTSESQRKSGFPHAWTTLDVYKHVGINVGIPMLQYLHDLKIVYLDTVYIRRPVRIRGRASNKEVVVRSLHANFPML